MTRATRSFDSSSRSLLPTTRTRTLITNSRSRSPRRLHLPTEGAKVKGNRVRTSPSLRRRRRTSQRSTCPTTCTFRAVFRTSRFSSTRSVTSPRLRALPCPRAREAQRVITHCGNCQSRSSTLPPQASRASSAMQARTKLGRTTEGSREEEEDTEPMRTSGCSRGYETA